MIVAPKLLFFAIPSSSLLLTAVDPSSRTRLPDEIVIRFISL